MKADAYRIAQARSTQTYRSGKAPPYEYVWKAIEHWFLPRDTQEEIAAAGRRPCNAV